jgi:P4 family phage/plasmid primase-like protien
VTDPFDDLNERANEREKQEQLKPPGEQRLVAQPDIVSPVEAEGAGLQDTNIMYRFHTKYSHLFCMNKVGEGSEIYIYRQEMNGRWTSTAVKEQIHSFVSTICADYARELIQIQTDLRDARDDPTRLATLTQRQASVIKLIQRTGRGNTIATLSTLLYNHLITLHLPKPVEMDGNPFVLNCKNGLVDLRTGKLDWPSPDDHLTRCTDVDYDSNADYAWWEKIVREICDHKEALYEFLHQWLGYCATGLRQENAFMVMHGNGANGKSLLMDAVGSALGGYATQFLGGLLEEKRGAGDNNDLFGQAALYGARFAYGSESADGGVLKSEMIKKMTGDQKITARRSRENPITIPVTFKLTLATNFTPQINAMDDAIFNRLRLFPCKVAFGDDQAILAGRAKYKADLSLARRIELDPKLKRAVLRWLVDGARKYVAAGSLVAPPEIRREVLAHRQAMDPFGQFVEECMVYAEPYEIERAEALYAARAHGDKEERKAWDGLKFADKLMIERSTLYKMYLLWSQEMHDNKPRSLIRFNQYLQSTPRVWTNEVEGEMRMDPMVCKKDSNGVWWWRWLRLSGEGMRFHEQAKSWEASRARNF